MDSCTCCEVIDEFALTTKVDLRSSHFSAVTNVRKSGRFRGHSGLGHCQIVESDPFPKSGSEVSAAQPIPITKRQGRDLSRLTMQHDSEPPGRSGGSSTSIDPTISVDLRSPKSTGMISRVALALEPEMSALAVNVEFGCECLLLSGVQALIKWFEGSGELLLLNVHGGSKVRARC